MKQTHTHDVVIVGGGPAGAFCAYTLAKNGIQVTIFDNSHPREKPCGGGISPETIEKFPLVNKFSSKGRAILGFKTILSENKKIMTTRPYRGYNISRRVFDEGILKMATENGAQQIKEKVIFVQKKHNLWQIKTEKQILTAKILIGADGVNSIVRHQTVGAHSAENLAITYGYLATGVEEEYGTIKFLDELHGYIWILPRDNHSSIGIGSALKHGAKLKQLLDAFIRIYCPNLEVLSEYAAMLPSATDPDCFLLPCAGENWLLVGDAAGHVDPITGAGILYALWSGKLAAEAIQRNDVESYDGCWRKEYGSRLRESCLNKEAFYDPVARIASIIVGLSNHTYSLCET